jgi:hypothetical protein
MAVTALLLLTGVWARSGLLVALATLALSPTIGAATAYTHATYSLVIEQPTVTVILFSLLAWVAYRASLGMEPDLQRLALISARTSLFLVNFGFWVGSLWGDSFRSGEARFYMGHAQTVTGLGLRACLGSRPSGHRCLGCTREPQLGGEPGFRIRGHPLLYPVF